MTRMGRPTDNPKPYRITVRIDEAAKEAIDKYCAQYNVNQGDAVRHGISLLYHEVKK